MRLHLAGFSWNDCSLSNTLFRRDAGNFAAYLVDAETGELHAHLTDGQREFDLETASINVVGELMDLQAGGRLHEAIDPLETGISLRTRYDALWKTINEPLVISREDRYLLEQRMRTLNDLDSYRVKLGMGSADEELAAHRWVNDRFERVMTRIPRELRGKLEPAQVFHEVLEHRWFMSEGNGHSVPFETAIEHYMMTVLPRKPDEQAVLGARPGAVSDDTMELRILLPPDS